MSKYLRCARRKCGWVGTEDEQKRRPHPDWSNASILVCPRCGNNEFYDAKEADKAKMKRCIMDEWNDFTKGKLNPNTRQRSVLMAWDAFLLDQPSDLDIMVNKLPELMTELYALASIEAPTKDQQ